MTEPFVTDPHSRIRRGSVAPARPQEIEVAELPTVQKVAFRRLNMRHRRVIVLHLQGLSHQDIAHTLGCSPAYVTNTLNNPLVKPVLDRCYQDYEAEFAALTPLTLRVLREEMEQDDDSGARLKAVDLTYKRQGAYAKKEHEAITAEDVIERILEIHGTDGSRIKLSERKFLRAGQADAGGDSPSSGEGEIVDV